jgi:hypothetical protein
MEQNKNPVNRFGTENYDLADYDRFNKTLPFDTMPINLVADKAKAYTKQTEQQPQEEEPNKKRKSKKQKYESKLMYTENKEG